jgi:hypothetical protein
MRRSQSIALTLGVLFAAAPSSATAQDVEAELHLFGQSGPFGGGAVLPGGRIGIRVSERLVIATGVSGSWGVFEGAGPEDRVQAWSIQIPLEAKLYLASPTVGEVAPLLRLVGTWSHAEFEGWTSDRGLGVAGLVGAQYMGSEHFGIMLEGGVDWSTHALGAGDEQRSTQLGVRWRTGVVLRI